MKYGETLFDIAYLVIALVSGLTLLRKGRKAPARLMGTAVLILGAGDAFHLVPRMLNYFVTGEWTAALGVGKFVTSITMTVFYLLMYRIWLAVYGETEDPGLTRTVWLLTGLRVVLCLFPQNHWLENESSVLWGVLRNLPFVALGVLVILLFYRKREGEPTLRSVWLLVTLSFAFYIPVAVGAGLVPILGMLMLPKTVCYILLFRVFLRYNKA